MINVGTTIYRHLKELERDNYYLVSEDGRPRRPELWGKLWDTLLKDAPGFAMTEEAYTSLRAGKHPVTGERLVQVGGKGQTHRAGTEITVNPDKSLSIFAATSKEANALVDRWINDANKEMLQVLEGLAQARMTVEGITLPTSTGNLAVMIQQHETSRSGDRGKHLHCIIFNMTKSPDGKVRAIMNDIYKSDLPEKLFENALGRIIQQDGYAIEWVKSESGKSEYCRLAGVPQKAIDANSTRSRDIKQSVKNLQGQFHMNRGELKQKAALFTRPDKKVMTLDEIQARYEANINAVGLTKENIARGVQNARQLAPRDERMTEYEIVSQAAKSLTDYESVFSWSQLLKSAATLSRGDHSTPDLIRAIGELDAEILKIKEGHTFRKGKQSYSDIAYTTKEVLQADRRFEYRVRQGKGQVEAVMLPDEAKAAISAYEAGKRAANPNFRPLTDSQKDALFFLLTNADRYKAVQGYAGATKTSALSAYNEILSSKGYDVIAISESNTAVNEMKAAGMANAHVTTKFLHNTELQNQVTEKTVVIGDETSFTGSKNADKVTKIIELKGARADFWGDKDQAPPVSAGHPFHHAIDNKIISFHEMKDIRRQKPEQYRAAIYDIINRDIEAALSKLNVIEISRADVLKADPGLAEKYRLEMEARQQNGAKQPVVSKELQAEITAKQQEMIRHKVAELYLHNNGYNNFCVPVETNAERHALNEQIRAGLVVDGTVMAGKQRQVWVNKGLTGIERFQAALYNPGDKLIAQESGAGISGGRNGIIIREVDVDRGKIIGVGNFKKGLEDREIDIRRHGDKFLAYERKNIEVGQNEKIIFNRTDKESGVANSEVAYVKLTNEDGSLSIEHRGELKTYSGDHFEHAYAITVPRVQGKTTFGTIPLEPRNYQSLYVGASRGEHEATIVTADYERLKDNVAQYVEKEMTANYGRDINQQIGKTQNELNAVSRQIEKESDPDKVRELQESRQHIMDKLDAYRDYASDINNPNREREPEVDRAAQKADQLELDNGPESSSDQTKEPDLRQETGREMELSL